MGIFWNRVIYFSYLQNTVIQKFNEFGMALATLTHDVSFHQRLSAKRTNTFLIHVKDVFLHKMYFTFSATTLSYFVKNK